MHNRLVRVVMIVILLGVLAGCGDQRILEKQGFIYSVGYDWLSKGKSAEGSVPGNKVKKDQLSVTVWLPVVSAESGRQHPLILQTVASTGKEGRFRLAKQTELSLASGQMRTALFNLQLASRGIMPYLDGFMRDPAVSQRLKIVVVDGTANEMLKKEYPSHMNTGPYIDHLLEKEVMNNRVPESTLYSFMRDYMDDGVDSVAPIIKQQGTHIEASGIALFDGDRYISRIDSDQTLIFAFLKGSFKYGEINIDLADQERKGEKAMFSSLAGNSKVKIKTLPGERLYRADISIKIHGILLEYLGDLQLNMESDKERLEKAIAAHINNEAESMVKELQKLGVDSIGIGKHVRNSLTYKEWKNIDWKAVYSNMDIRCNTKVTIQSVGKFEK
jgi:spore germination protein